MRKNPTPAEDTLWQRLRKHQVAGAKFRRQHAIDRFIVDFYCAETRLIIEVDGDIHQYTQEEDALRQQFLESQGLRVLRFSNDAVLNHTDHVISEIETAIQHIRAYHRITAAAVALHTEREAWLNPHKFPPPPAGGTQQTSPPSPLSAHREGELQSSPPPFTGGDTGGGKKPPADLRDRTLTNLYNALAVYRGLDTMRTKPAAANFAPRLNDLHRELDEAVCDAYGWEYDILDDEEEILRRLLALNLSRS